MRARRVSATAGRSGKRGRRCVEATASALTVPASSAPAIPEYASITSGMRPPIMSLRTCACHRQSRAPWRGRMPASLQHPPAWREPTRSTAPRSIAPGAARQCNQLRQRGHAERRSGDEQQRTAKVADRDEAARTSIGRLGAAPGGGNECGQCRKGERIAVGKPAATCAAMAPPPPGCLTTSTCWPCTASGGRRPPARWTSTALPGAESVMMRTGLFATPARARSEPRARARRE